MLVLVSTIVMMVPVCYYSDAGTSVYYSDAGTSVYYSDDGTSVLL